MPLFAVSTIAQFTGAFMGIILAYVCMWQMEVDADMRTIATFKPTTSSIGAFLSEMVCSFLFIIVILMVKNPVTSPSKEGWYGAFTVGLSLLCNITLSAGHTGASLNPAVGLVQVIYESW
jgi:glycerol uptake facilitator-like aquaporin